METLDQSAVNLAKSIRQNESGGNFSARGKSGEYGAYQFTEPTWNNYSKQYGISVPLEQATPEQQNEVAYKKIKEWKDAGYNVGQVASMWNAGEKRKDAYLEGNKGVNDKGVSYDTAKYAENVAKTYQDYKSGNQNPDITPSSSTVDGYATKAYIPEGGMQQESGQPQNTGLLNQISNRLGDAGQALTQASTGQINPLSGLLQTAGAVGGAVGDVTSSLIKHIPILGGIFQGAEDIIGTGVKNVTENTTLGKAVVNEVQKFQASHPELAADIGAGFNIVTAIPILKGLGAVKEVVGSALSQSLKDVAEKSVMSEMTSVLSKTPAGKALLEDGGEQAIKESLVDSRHILGVEIENGRYATKEAQKVIESKINRLPSTGENLNEYINNKDVLDKSLEALKLLDGAEVSSSKIGGAVKTGITSAMVGAGETAGRALGIPGIGGLLGYGTRKVAHKIADKALSVKSLTRSVLKRSGANAVPVTAKKIAKTGLIGSSLLQKKSK